VPCDELRDIQLHALTPRFHVRTLAECFERDLPQLRSPDGSVGSEEVSVRRDSGIQVRCAGGATGLCPGCSGLISGLSIEYIAVTEARSR
jgi:hypothetical protein